jgi:FKBP-type peptidyl-prolyl cis-trans isomerase FkpA
MLLLAAVVLVGCKPGEKKLPSGYKYIKHTNKGGKFIASGDVVYLNSQMRDDQNKVVGPQDNGPLYQQIQIPDTSQLRGQPLPWSIEALFRMKEGDSLTVIVPLDTVKADMKPQGFEKSKLMYIDIAVKKVFSKKQMEAAATKMQQEMMTSQKKRQIQDTVLAMSQANSKMKDFLQRYKANQLGAELKTTKSGLKYVVHEQGKGPKAKTADYVMSDYYGVLTSNGRVFDSSFRRTEDTPFPAGVGQVIPGWDEAFSLFNEGSKVTIIVPPALGYGVAGSPPVIPGNSELAFYMEINKVLVMPQELTGPRKSGK